MTNQAEHARAFRRRALELGFCVNESLTLNPGRKRRRRAVETRDVAAFLRRMLDAYGRRVNDGDPDDLTDLLDLGRRLDVITRTAVVELRERHGFSWADIGRAAGVTRQGAQQRYGS